MKAIDLLKYSASFYKKDAHRDSRACDILKVDLNRKLRI
jgi:hypothetical protein